MIDLILDHTPEIGEEFLVFIDENDAQVFHLIAGNYGPCLTGQNLDMNIYGSVEQSVDGKLHLSIDNNQIEGEDADSLNDGATHHIKIGQKTINKLDYNKLENIPCYSQTIVGSTLFDGEFEVEEKPMT